LQRLEVEPACGCDHELAVDHAARGQALAKDRLELREVTIERLQITALDVEPLAIAKHDGSKPVPLRLEEPPVASRQLRCELRKHRLDRRVDGEVCDPCVRRHSSYFSERAANGKPSSNRARRTCSPSGLGRAGSARGSGGAASRGRAGWWLLDRVLGTRTSRSTLIL